MKNHIVTEPKKQKDALLTDIQQGETAKVKTALAKSTNPNVYDEYGRSGLLIAARLRNAKMVHLLRETGASTDALTDAFLEVLEFPEASSTPEFAMMTLRLSKWCEAIAKPLEGVAGAVCFDLTQRVEHLTKLPSMDASTVAEEIVKELQTTYYEECLAGGFLLILLNRFQTDAPVFALFPTNNPFAVLAAIGVNGVNYDHDTADIIAWLQNLDREQPFRLTGCSADYLEATFLTPVQQASELANRLYEFCPDTVEQGTLTVEALALEMEKTNSLFLWWD